TVAAETPLLELVHLFVVGQIRGAPVVDRTGAVLGVVSTTDLLRTVDQVCDDEIDAGEPASGAGALRERLASLTAIDVATPEVAWVSPDAPVAQVARRMRAEGIHRVLVG